MNVFVVGTGKLAQEILAHLSGTFLARVVPWAERETLGPADGVVVHAGSGRELAGVLAFCQEHAVPLVELATGSSANEGPVGFPLVICPNTNILLLRFLEMLSRSGALFSNYPKAILESHQASKTTEPGTAYALAKLLQVPKEDVVSVRDPAVQKDVLGIPSNYLPRHAYHKITIGDATVNLTFETRVLGPAPYAAGLAEVLGVLNRQKLENRTYEVLEFFREGWL